METKSWIVLPKGLPWKGSLVMRMTALFCKRKDTGTSAIRRAGPLQDATDCIPMAAGCLGEAHRLLNALGKGGRAGTWSRTHPESVVEDPLGLAHTVDVDSNHRCRADTP